MDQVADCYFGLQMLTNYTESKDASSMKKLIHIQLILMAYLFSFSGYTKPAPAKDGNWEGCVVGMYLDAQGATNVRWLWVPHGPSTDRLEEPWNDVSNYWPGSDYVDWIGLDGYNFYPQDPWGGKRPLRNFDDCFGQLYDDCASLDDQPMIIAEFGTGEFEYNGFDKAAWITDAFKKIQNKLKVEMTKSYGIVTAFSRTTHSS